MATTSTTPLGCLDRVQNCLQGRTAGEGAGGQWRRAFLLSLCKKKDLCDYTYGMLLTRSFFHSCHIGRTWWDALRAVSATLRAGRVGVQWSSTWSSTAIGTWRVTRGPGTCFCHCAERVMRSVSPHVLSHALCVCVSVFGRVSTYWTPYCTKVQCTTLVSGPLPKCIKSFARTKLREGGVFSFSNTVATNTL